MADLTAKSGKCGVKEAKLIVSSLTTEGTKIFTEETERKTVNFIWRKVFRRGSKELVMNANKNTKSISVLSVLFFFGYSVVSNLFLAFNFAPFAFGLGLFAVKNLYLPLQIFQIWQNHGR